MFTLHSAYAVNSILKVQIMNALKKISQAALAVSVALSGQAFAEDFSFVEAMKNGKTNVIFRTRYEQVEQDNALENASALTNKTRLSFSSANFGSWKFNLEMDNVAALTSDYNSTANGYTNYSVVADPEGTDLNLANLTYKNDGTTAVIGRQRINIDGQRFVGGVGWRQNEQTFDAVLVNHQLTDAFNVAYAYVHNVNRIFGPTGAGSDVYGDNYVLTGGYKVNDNHKLGFTGVYLDPDNAAALGSTTFGVDYKGKFGDFSVNLAYATQSDDGHAVVDYNADYTLAEFSWKIKPVTLSVGNEVLGSDNGVKGFTTPLATLHKFQGFADMFLGTPAEGVNDLYFKVAGKAGPAKLALFYHDFTSDFGSIDYGSEIDLVANFVINKNYSFLAKYASYSADNYKVDTDKLWLMFTAKF